MLVLPRSYLETRESFAPDTVREKLPVRELEYAHMKVLTSTSLSFVVRRRCCLQWHHPAAIDASLPKLEEFGPDFPHRFGLRRFQMMVLGMHEQFESDLHGVLDAWRVSK